jgi:DNA adenine methylase
MSSICPISIVNSEFRSKCQAKPFLKWAGGKTQLIDEFNLRLPKSIIATHTIEKYVEPFVGGGAMFFFLKRKYLVKKAFLFDINRELIIGYRVIQSHPKELIERLTDIEEKYLRMEDEKRKDFYYKVRNHYNQTIKDFNYKNYSEDWIARAAHLIFLNKTCFNGLFRQNQKGEFNVPFGKYKKPKICDALNILEVCKALENTEIIRGDFTESRAFIDKHTFIYFDPPYRPLNTTSSFTSYDKAGFEDKDQKRLAQFFKTLHKTSVYQMLSNSDPKNCNKNDDFFEKLYRHKDFTIERVSARRYINCDSSKRGDISELIIRNY